jgi:chorismate-pyruvate lyase
MVPLMASNPTDLECLLDSPDTVTHFLETLTGERLVANVVRQYPLAAGTDNALGVTAGQTTTHRISVLKGCTTRVPYVYAESTFVPGRLPEAVLAQLERTSDPIGRVLVTHGLGLGREPLLPPGRVGAHAPGIDADFVSEIVWSRAYRLTIDGQPVFSISEWFLRSVLDVLDRQAQTS